jgi:hypothetical protein
LAALPFGLYTFFRNEAKKKEPFELLDACKTTQAIGPLKHSFFAEKAVLMA